MKKNSVFFGMIALVFAAFLTSCQKEDSVVDITTEDDITTLETVSEDIDDDIYRYAGELKDFSDCVVVTFAQPEGTFPNTITLDYGAGCTGDNGRTRVGQIVIDASAQLNNPGAVVTTTFVGFSVNGIGIDGSKTITNNGLNADGDPSFTKTTDIMATFLDGTQAEWHTNRTRTIFKGADTPVLADDKILVEGSAYGTNRNGVDFTVTINQGLVKARSCPWISAGIIEFSTANVTRTLNFGEGQCNNKAIASDNQGHYRIVTLHGGL